MTSFLLLISLSLALFSVSQADLIGDICSKTVNPTLCNDSLRSDPHSSGADLRILAQIAVDKAISATSTTVQVANSLANGSNKQKAETCVDSANKAIDILNQIRSLLSSGSGGTSANLPTEVIAAFTNISFCDSQFGRDEPPQLKDVSYRAQGLVNVLSVIVNSL